MHRCLKLLPFLGTGHEQCLVSASLDNGEATATSYIISTGAGSGATCRTSNPFFRTKAKTVTGREERRGVQDCESVNQVTAASTGTSITTWVGFDSFIFQGDVFLPNSSAHPFQASYDECPREGSVVIGEAHCCKS